MKDEDGRSSIGHSRRDRVSSLGGCTFPVEESTTVMVRHDSLATIFVWKAKVGFVRGFLSQIRPPGIPKYLRVGQGGAQSLSPDL